MGYHVCVKKKEAIFHTDKKKKKAWKIYYKMKKNKVQKSLSLFGKYIYVFTHWVLNARLSLEGITRS